MLLFPFRARSLSVAIRNEMPATESARYLVKILLQMSLSHDDTMESRLTRTRRHARDHEGLMATAGRSEPWRPWICRDYG